MLVHVCVCGGDVTSPSSPVRVVELSGAGHRGPALDLGRGALTRRFTGFHQVSTQPLQPPQQPLQPPQQPLVPPLHPPLPPPAHPLHPPLHPLHPPLRTRGVVVMGVRGTGTGALGDSVVIERARGGLEGGGGGVFVSVMVVTRDDIAIDALAPHGKASASSAASSLTSSSSSSSSSAQHALPASSASSFSAAGRVGVAEDAATGVVVARGLERVQAWRVEGVRDVLAQGRTAAALRARAAGAGSGTYDLVMVLWADAEGQIPLLTVAELASTFEDTPAQGGRRPSQGKPGRSHEALLDVLFAMSKSEGTRGAVGRRAPSFRPHPPFRQSKVTMMLREALRGTEPLVAFMLVRGEAAHIEATTRAVAFAERLGLTMAGAREEWLQHINDLRKDDSLSQPAPAPVPAPAPAPAPASAPTPAPTTSHTNQSFINKPQAMNSFSNLSTMLPSPAARTIDPELAAAFAAFASPPPPQPPPRSHASALPQAGPAPLPSLTAHVATPAAPSFASSSPSPYPAPSLSLAADARIAERLSAALSARLDLEARALDLVADKEQLEAQLASKETRCAFLASRVEDLEALLSEREREVLRSKKDMTSRLEALSEELSKERDEVMRVRGLLEAAQAGPRWVAESAVMEDQAAHIRSLEERLASFKESYAGEIARAVTDCRAAEAERDRARAQAAETLELLRAAEAAHRDEAARGERAVEQSTKALDGLDALLKQALADKAEAQALAQRVAQECAELKASLERASRAGEEAAEAAEAAARGLRGRLAEAEMRCAELELAAQGDAEERLRAEAEVERLRGEVERKDTAFTQAVGIIRSLEEDKTSASGPGGVDRSVDMSAALLADNLSEERIAALRAEIESETESKMEGLRAAHQAEVAALQSQVARLEALVSDLEERGADHSFCAQSAAEARDLHSEQLARLQAQLDIANEREREWEREREREREKKGAGSPEPAPRPEPSAQVHATPAPRPRLVPREPRPLASSGLSKASPTVPVLRREFARRLAGEAESSGFVSPAAPLRIIRNVSFSKDTAAMSPVEPQPTPSASTAATAAAAVVDDEEEEARWIPSYVSEGPPNTPSTTVEVLRRKIKWLTDKSSVEQAKITKLEGKLELTQKQLERVTAQRDELKAKLSEFIKEKMEAEHTVEALQAVLSKLNRKVHGGDN
jgi:hypothetical protein